LAVHDGKRMSAQGLEDLTSLQQAALEQSAQKFRSVATNLADEHLHLVSTSVDAFKKKVDGACYAYERVAQKDRVVIQEKALADMAQAKATEDISLKELNVERKKEQVDYQKAKNKQQLDHQIASDEKQLEEEGRMFEAKMQAADQQLLLDKQRSEMELQRQQQQDDFSRVQKEYENAMKAYSAELQDATQRCWGSKTAMIITKQPPKMSRHPDGTRYVTEWFVNYKPKVEIGVCSK